MASYYVDSTVGGGAGTGADWANAFTTLAGALSGKAAGDIFYVAHDHAETQASAMTLTFPATAAAPNYVYCVNSAGSVPPVHADLRTTATISTTGASAMTITNSVAGGNVYIYGIGFSAAGGGANAADLTAAAGNGSRFRFDSCSLTLATTSNRTLILGGVAGANQIDLINTTFGFGATGQQLALRNCRINWTNTAGSSAITGTIPTILLGISSSNLCSLLFAEGIDLTAVSTGKTLVGVVPAASKFIFKDCKLDANGTISSRQSSIAHSEVYIIRSDSAGNNYRHEKPGHYCGDQTVETTIVRTGGASDGTTPIAWKVVTTANSKWIAPFECIPISIWNETTGSAITLTVHGIWGGGAVPNNDDIWMDVVYPGSATFPTASFNTTTKASGLATNAAVAADTETWGGSTTKFKLETTVTPEMKGPITIYIRVAAASATFYICPKITVS